MCFECLVNCFVVCDLSCDLTAVTLWPVSVCWGFAYLGTMLHSIMHQLCHLVCKAWHAHGSAVDCSAPNSGALPHLGRGVHNLLHKGVIDPLLDKEALSTSTVLPAAEERSLHGNWHCLQDKVAQALGTQGTRGGVSVGVLGAEGGGGEGDGMLPFSVGPCC